jgi:hypothetical protein
MIHFPFLENMDGTGPNSNKSMVSPPPLFWLANTSTHIDHDGRLLSSLSQPSAARHTASTMASHSSKEFTALKIAEKSQRELAITRRVQPSLF